MQNIKDALKLAVGPYLARKEAIEGEIVKIEAPITAKVEAKRKELLSKMESDLGAFRSSCLDKQAADKLNSLTSELAEANKTNKGLYDLYLAQTFRTRAGRVQPGTIDPKTNKIVKGRMGQTYKENTHTFVFADASQLELPDAVFLDDQKKSRVSGPGAGAYDALTSSGFSDGQARSFIDKHREVLGLKG